MTGLIVFEVGTMVGVSRVVIKESSEDLKELMHQQDLAWCKERLQMLYLLKSGQAESVTHAATILGRGRVTLQRWLIKYAVDGVLGLLRKEPHLGRVCQIPAEAQAALVERLATPTGFGSYGEIQDWLKSEYQHDISYEGIHKHVRYGLQAKLKRPRPVSTDQDPAKVAFFKTT
jgi:transposase